MDGRIVEAIEEGKIVRVSEDYARKEGLMILRKPFQEIGQEAGLDRNDRNEEGFIDLSIKGWERKEIDKYKKNNVIKELIDNFHWYIAKTRREKGITRRQMADSIGEKENVVKLVENGILPKDDFVLVSKIENYLGINLRKNKQEIGQPMRAKVERQNARIDFGSRKQESGKQGAGGDRISKEDKVVGDDIEILE